MPVTFAKQWESRSRDFVRNVMSNEEQKQDELELEQPVNNTESESKTEEPEQDQGSFEAGFAKARGDGAEPTPAEEPTPEEPEPEEEAEAESESEGEPEAEPTEPEEKPEEKSELDKALERLAKLEGRYGNLQQRFNTMNASQQRAAEQTAQHQVDAPSETQVRAALKNGDKLKELIDEFPSFKPMLEELEVQNQKIEEKQGFTQQDMDRLVEQTTQQTIINIENENLMESHPDWMEVVRTPEFRSWSIDGGPTEAEFTQLQSLDGTNPQAQQNILNAWQGLYPEWWLDKGQRMFSNRPSDTQRMMDSFSDFTKSKTVQPKTKTRDKKRLERAVAPQGAVEPPTTGLSDDEAFNRGFNRARGH